MSSEADLETPENGLVRQLSENELEGEESCRKYESRTRALNLGDAGSRAEPYTNCWPTQSISVRFATSRSAIRGNMKRFC